MRKILRKIEAVVGFFLAVMFLAGVWVMLGCRTMRCTPGESRCNGNIAEICDGNGLWVTNEDCSKVQAPYPTTWTCCYIAKHKGYTCMPQNVCSPDGATP